MRIIAHRGVSSLAPENTMAAFVKCLEVGAKWFECDVRMLGDNSLIVAHDETAERTTTGTGRFFDLTFADLRRLDAGRWFGDGFRLERVPELATVLDLLNTTGLSANLELKFEESDPEVVRTYLETIAHSTRALKQPDRVLVSSFSAELLSGMAALAPDLARALLVDEVGASVDQVVAQARDLGCDAVNPGLEGLTADRVQALKAAGLAVYVWTVNSVETARELAEWGVDGVFTDYPQDLLAAGLDQE